MSDEKNGVSVKGEHDYFYPCVVLLIVLFWGEPDLMGSLIEYLRSRT